MLNLTTEALLPSRQCFGQVYLHCKICFGRKYHIARQLAREWGQHFVFFCLFVVFVVIFFHVSISMITRQRSILLTNTTNWSDTSFSQVTEILQYLVLGKFRLQCCKKWYLQLVSESLGSLQVLLQCIGNLPCNLWREVALEICAVQDHLYPNWKTA